MSKILIPFPVPTSTVIAYHKDSPYLVYLIRQAKKHKKRMTLVGGRCELPDQTHLDCIRDEWKQEAGGQNATLKNLRHWATKTDRDADPRETTLGKLTGNKCPKKLINQPVLGLYGCPDEIYLAEVDGTPFPSDGEATECILYDVRDLLISADESYSEFGAQHDLLLALYCRHLNGKPVDHNFLSDMFRLRIKLLEFQAFPERDR